MKENYQTKLEKILETISDSKPTLLLHSCCGPCSTYVLDYLTNYFDITVYFYNPNIMPDTEYSKRLETQKQVLGNFKDVKFLEGDPSNEPFLQLIKGLENESEHGARCHKCIEMRISSTAKLAKDLAFDYFCTTLSVSPHKDAELINSLSEKYATLYSVPALPSDFKKKNGYLNSIRLSKEMDLYRQDYCGCIFSKQSKK